MRHIYNALPLKLAKFSYDSTIRQWVVIPCDGIARKGQKLNAERRDGKRLIVVVTKESHAKGHYHFRFVKGK